MFLSRGATTIFTLFLAKLLAPEAFGLVAMATVVFELSNVFVNSGLSQALIRSKSVSDLDLNTVFYSNLIFSIFAYLFLFFIAPYVSEFYKQPELTLLIQVMGLVAIINATKIVQVAVLSRSMNFKAQMKANSLGAFLSGVLALLAAYEGFGVWSLVVMMLSQSLIPSLILWMASSWRPNLSFSFESFYRLFAFGKNLLAEGMLNVAFQNSYVLVIGRVFSAEITGLYFFAKKVTDLLSHQLTGAVQQATYPALSTLQDDNLLLRHKYRQILQLMLLLIAPVMGFMAALSLPIFEIFFGERWRGSVLYLQLLCFVGVLYPLHALNINILNVKGRSDLVLKIGVLKKVVSVTLLFAGLPFGVLGIVIGQIVASLIALIPNAYYSARLIEYSLAAQLKDVSKPMFSALFAATISWIVAGSNPNASLGLVMVSGILGLIVYFSFNMIFRTEGLIIILNRMK